MVSGELVIVNCATAASGIAPFEAVSELVELLVEPPVELELPLEELELRTVDPEVDEPESADVEEALVPWLVLLESTDPAEDPTPDVELTEYSEELLLDELDELDEEVLGR